VGGAEREGEREYQSMKYYSTSEKNVFQGLPSVTGSNTVGHYTQMVWKSTTQVGCGTATSNNYAVLSCRYTPPGNVIGQKPY